MAQTLEQALKDARFELDDREYVLVGLPASAITAAAAVIAEVGEPFAAMIADTRTVTLVLAAEAFDDFARRLPDHEIGGTRFRLITLDLVLEPTLVGLMARMATTLAEAGIPVFPYSAYARDLLLVPAPHADAALAALNRLRG